MNSISIHLATACTLTTHTSHVVSGFFLNRVALLAAHTLLKFRYMYAYIHTFYTDLQVVDGALGCATMIGFTLYRLYGC